MTMIPQFIIILPGVPLGKLYSILAVQEFECQFFIIIILAFHNEGYSVVTQGKDYYLEIEILKAKDSTKAV